MQTYLYEKINLKDMKRRLVFKSNIDSFEILEKNKALVVKDNKIKLFDEIYYKYTKIFEKKELFNSNIFFERNSFYEELNEIFGFFYIYDIDNLVLKKYEHYDFKSIGELVENMQYMQDEKNLINKLVKKIYDFFFDSSFLLNYYYMHSLLFNNELKELIKIVKDDEIIVEILNKSAALIYTLPDEMNLFDKISFVQVKYKKKDVNLKNVRDKVMDIASKSIGYSYNIDDIIIKQIEAIYDLERIIEQMSKRLRDMVSIYDYDLSLLDQDLFLNNIIDKEFSKNRIGKIDCDMKDAIIFAKTIIDNKKALDKLSKSLETIMKTNFPNLTYTAGYKMGANFISHAGSFFTLFIFPASTIQLMGAETALFRHLVTHAKPPKHGIIANHPLVLKSKNKGRMARRLASLIARSTKYDFAKRGLIIKKEYEKLENEII